MARGFPSALVALSALSLIVAACAAQPAAPASQQPAKPAAQAPAKPSKVYKIVASNGLNPGDPTVDVMNDFKKEVEEKSGGQIQVELYVSAQLGKTEETVEMVKSGASQMLTSSPQYISKYSPEIQVLSLPYLFDSTEAADKALDGPLGDEIRKLVEEKTDFKILAFEEFGFKNIINRKRPINVVEDLRGLKLRVIDSPITIKTFESLGASPIGMTWSEVYTAIQTGVIDGAEVPFTVIRAAKTFEVAKYISATGHFYEIAMVYGNKTFFNSLPPDLQKVVTDALQNMQKKERQISRAGQKTAREFMASQGTQINDVAPAEIAKMRGAVKPVYDWAKQQWSEAFVSKVLKSAGQ